MSNERVGNMEEVNRVTERIIGAAIEVHRILGPGMLESTYEACLEHELQLRRLRCVRQVAIPVRYKAVTLDCGYRADVIVESLVILELKAVEKLDPVHTAQLLSQLKFANLHVGLLLNFKVERLIQGIHRVILD